MAASERYREWVRSRDKDDLDFYGSAEFRKDYTALDTDIKARMFRDRTIRVVEHVLRDIASKTKRHDIRILSLGCGPGSDLLGILEAVDSLLGEGVICLNGVPRCHFIGVDAFDWDRSYFRQRIMGLVFNGNFTLIPYKFVHDDMESYVLSHLRGHRHSEFDFICLSFVDAGSKLELLGTALPQLLSEFGRILVLDSNFPSVRSLTDYGYTCTFAGYGICMHNRGRDADGPASRVPSLPSEHSRIQVYRGNGTMVPRERLLQQSRWENQFCVQLEQRRRRLLYEQGHPGKINRSHDVPVELFLYRRKRPQRLRQELARFVRCLSNMGS